MAGKTKGYLSDKDLLPPEVRAEVEGALKKCYACSKCTSGCPVASGMDFPPSLLIKGLALGRMDKMLASKAIWICSSCQNCYSRCPFEINIPRIIDLLKEYAYKQKLTREERGVRLFHKVFLSNVRRYGRIHEMGFIGEWKILSGKWFSDLVLGARMFLKGKLSLAPEKIKKQDEVKRLFESHGAEK